MRQERILACYRLNGLSRFRNVFDHDINDVINDYVSDLEREAFFEGSAGHDRVGRRPNSDRIERLDEPAVGAGTASEVHVGGPIEQHHDGNVWQPTAALLEPEVHRGGHTAHVSDLKIENDEVGSAVDNGLRHVLAVVANPNCRSGTAESSPNVVGHPGRVGRQKHIRHKPLTLPADEMPSHFIEPAEITDIANQQRHPHNRGVHGFRQGCDQRCFRLGDAAQFVEVLANRLG
jgi:hypothetical protein